MKPTPEEAREADWALVRRAQSGDSGAVTELYMRHRQKVFSYLYRFTGNRTSAEDLTQETFVRVVRHLPRYRPTGSFAGWVCRIAGNLALKEFRAHPAGREVSLDEPVALCDGESVDRSEAIPSGNPGPQQELARVETESAVQSALMKIAPVYRETVILCDIEGFGYREAAEMCRVSINTVASRLARGRAQLAKALGYLKRERA